MSKRDTLSERAWRYIEPEPNSGCWLWVGSVNRDGYARIGIGGGSPAEAHRALYELYVGPIPAALELDHKCRVRCCVNPAHLEPVTHRENAMRGTAGDRHRHAIKMSHCVHGHSLSGRNVRVGRRGARICRACINEAAARYRARRKT